MRLRVQSCASPELDREPDVRSKVHTKSRQPLRHPIGALRTPAVAAIVGHVAAVRDHQEFHWTFGFSREPLGVLPRYDAILLSGYDEQRAGDAACNSLERKRCGVAFGVLLSGAMATRPERLPRELGQSVPCVQQVERPRQRDAGLYSLFKCRSARRVIAAEAHTP